MTEIEERREYIREYRNEKSKQASSTGKVLAGGVLALVWGMMALGNGQDLLTYDWQRYCLMVSGVCALASLMFDYLHAQFGYLIADRAYDRVFAQDFKVEDGMFPDEDWRYKWTVYAFNARQILAPISAVIVIVAIAPSLVTWDGKPTAPTNLNKTQGATGATPVAESTMRSGVVDGQSE